MPRTAGLVLHLAWVRWWSALAYYAFSLAQGMNAAGRPSRVIAPPGSPLGLRARSHGLDGGEWAGLASSRPDRFLAAVARLRKAAVEGRVDGVFVHTGAGHAAAAAALRGSRAPVLRVRAEIRRPAGGVLQRLLYSRGSWGVLISGSFMREGIVERLGVPPGRIHLLPAGIDCGQAGRIGRESARARLRERQGWPPSSRVIGMLARYSPVKGHRDLIDAARIIAPHHADVRFFLAGPPGQVGIAGVREWVREAGLEDRFAILDAVEDPLDVAAGFDIAVIASRGSEAVCRSALEYMALGLPIVATEVNVIPETLGSTGVLVPPLDPPTMATVIERLLDDPARGRQLGESAAERVRRQFDLTVIARQAISLLAVARGDRHGTD